MVTNALVGANDVEVGEVVFGYGEGGQVFGFDGVVDADQFVPVDGVEQVERARRRGRHHEPGHARAGARLQRQRLARGDVLTYRVTLKALGRFVAFAALALVCLFYPAIFSITLLTSI